jgi:hypothetical protein
VSVNLVMELRVSTTLSGLVPIMIIRYNYHYHPPRTSVLYVERYDETKTRLQNFRWCVWLTTMTAADLII